MAPLAYAAQAMIAGIVVFSVIVGAIGGAIVWNARAGLAVGGLATAALYFVAAAALGASNVRALLTVGIPPLFLADAVLIVLLMVFWTDARHNRAARSF